MKRLRTWNRERRFLLAYRILRNESERHRAAGHPVEFVAVSTSLIELRCPGCPEAHPDVKGRIL